MAIIGVDALMKELGDSNYIERVSDDGSVRYIANIPLAKFGKDTIKSFMTKVMDYHLRPMKALLDDVSKGEDSILYKMVDAIRGHIGTDYFDHVIYHVAEFFTTDNCIRVYYMSRDKASFSRMLSWTAKCNLIYGVDMSVLVKEVVVPYIQKVLIPSMKFTKEDEKLFNEDNQEHRKEGDTYYSQCLNINVPIARAQDDPFRIMTYFSPKKTMSGISFNGNNAYFTSGRGGRGKENQFLLDKDYGYYALREHIEVSPIDGLSKYVVRDFYNIDGTRTLLVGFVKRLMNCTTEHYDDAGVLKELDLSDDVENDAFKTYLMKLTPKRSAVDMFTDEENLMHLQGSKYFSPALPAKTIAYSKRDELGYYNEVSYNHNFTGLHRKPSQLKLVGGIIALNNDLEDMAGKAAIRSFIKSCCDKFDYYDEFEHMYDSISILDKIYGFDWSAFSGLEGLASMLQIKLYATSGRPFSGATYNSKERESSKIMLSRGGTIEFQCELKRVY